MYCDGGALNPKFPCCIFEQRLVATFDELNWVLSLVD